jgi:hypothetical protein
MGAAASSLDIPLTKGTSGVSPSPRARPRARTGRSTPASAAATASRPARCSSTRRSSGCWRATRRVRAHGRRAPADGLLRVRLLLVRVSFAHSAGAAVPRRQGGGAQAAGARRGMSGARRKTLEIRTSPHITRGYDTDAIMFNVVVALRRRPRSRSTPSAGRRSALLATAVGSCLLAERAPAVWAGRPTTLGDWSAAVTGLLFGLTLPPACRSGWWRWAVRLDLAVGKSIFGGLGFNPLQSGAGRPRLAAGGVSGGDDDLAPAFAASASPPCPARSSPCPSPNRRSTTRRRPAPRRSRPGSSTARRPTPPTLALRLRRRLDRETSALLILARRPLPRRAQLHELAHAGRRCFGTVGALSALSTRRIRRATPRRSSCSARAG